MAVQLEQLVLWGREQRPRIHVHLRPMTAWHGPDGEAHVDGNGNGQVDVWLEPADPTVPIIAAHEVGHVRRELAGLMATAYLEARVTIRGKSAAQILGSVPLTTRELMLEEEALAWDGGREVLAELGFDDWGLFEQTRERGLGVYREILQLEAA